MRLIVASLLIFAGQAVAQTTTIGDWTIGRTTDNDGFFAAVMNDSGGILGKYCLGSVDGCFWVFMSGITCEAESSYPVMLNTAKGAYTTSLVCRPVEGKPRLIFEEFDVIDKAVTGTEQIGLAFPMKDGKFTVSRFNVTRQDSALSALGRLSSQLKRSSRNTRDQRL